MAPLKPGQWVFDVAYFNKKGKAVVGKVKDVMFMGKYGWFASIVFYDDKGVRIGHLARMDERYHQYSIEGIRVISQPDFPISIGDL